MKIGIARLSESVERIASGDLTTRLNVVRAGGTRTEGGHLLESLDRMTDSLIEIVKQARSSAVSIVAMSQDIAEGNTRAQSRG